MLETCQLNTLRRIKLAGLPLRHRVRRFIGVIRQVRHGAFSGISSETLSEALKVAVFEDQTCRFIFFQITFWPRGNFFIFSRRNFWENTKNTTFFDISTTPPLKPHIGVSDHPVFWCLIDPHMNHEAVSLSTLFGSNLQDLSLGGFLKTTIRTRLKGCLGLCEGIVFF